LNFKTDHITEEFGRDDTNLAQMMDGRLDEVTQGFAQKSLAIVQLMDDRSAQITEGLVDPPAASPKPSPPPATK